MKLLFPIKKNKKVFIILTVLIFTFLIALDYINGFFGLYGRVGLFNYFHLLPFIDVYLYPKFRLVVGADSSINDLSTGGFILYLASMILISLITAYLLVLLISKLRKRSFLESNSRPNLMR